MMTMMVSEDDYDDHYDDDDTFDSHKTDWWENEEQVQMKRTI